MINCHYLILIREYMKYKLIHTDTRNGQGDQRYYLLDTLIKYTKLHEDDDGIHSEIEYTTNIVCCSHSIGGAEVLLFVGGYDDNNELEIKSFSKLAGKYHVMQSDCDLINRIYNN